LRHGAAGAIAWLPTLLRGRPKSRDDLIRQPRSQQASELWLVIVDASASTKRHQALSQAKGLLAQLFDDAYRRRSRLALMTANGNAPRWQHHGLKASRALLPWLEELGAGGGTPLVLAFKQAGEWLEARQKKHPAEQQRVLVVTDGRVKDLPSTGESNCPGLLVDIESGPIRLRKAEQMAVSLGLDYQHIESLRTL
jgi:magnesium chelatase subunit ChlD-like protein